MGQEVLLGQDITFTTESYAKWRTQPQTLETGGANIPLLLSSSIHEWISYGYTQCTGVGARGGHMCYQFSLDTELTPIHAEETQTQRLEDKGVDVVCANNYFCALAAGRPGESRSNASSWKICNSVWPEVCRPMGLHFIPGACAQAPSKCMSCCPAVSNVSDSINFNVTEAVAVATAVGLPQDAQGIPVTIFISFIHGVNFSSASVRTEVMPETPAGARAQPPLVRYQVVHAGWQFKGRTIPQFEPVAHFPGFPASVTRLRVRVTVLPCLRCEAYGQEAWTKFQFVSVHVRQSYHPDKLNNKVSLSASRDPADRALQLLSYGHSGTRMSASITAIWEQAYNVSI